MLVASTAGAATGPIAARIAAACASEQLRTLVIDAAQAIRRSDFGIEVDVDTHAWVEREDGSLVLSQCASDPVPGTLPTLRRGFARYDDAPVHFCAGPPPRQPLDGLTSTFHDLENRFDVVLVNAPPLLVTPRAVPLASAARNALLVAYDRGSVPDHQELVRRLRLAGALPIGYVYCSAALAKLAAPVTTTPPVVAPEDDAPGEAWNIKGGAMTGGWVKHKTAPRHHDSAS